MKRIYLTILAALVIIPLILVIPAARVFRSGDPVPTEEPNLHLQTVDSNKDGKPDSWAYRTENRIPVKWIRDSNHDGRLDGWSFFEGGRAFLDEDDTDRDGKVDVIYLHLRDSVGARQRSLMLVLKDSGHNVFELHEDTGWVPEEASKTEKVWR